MTKAAKPFDIDAEEVLDTPDVLEVDYAVSIASGFRSVPTSSVIGRANDACFASEIQQRLAAQRLPAQVSVKTRAASRELGQLEVTLRWDLAAPGAEAAPVQKFLDGACMVYVESLLAQVVDFRSAHQNQMTHDGSETPARGHMCRSINRAIRHSGDLPVGDVGEHRLEVDLLALPLEVTDLYFVLSAFESDDLSSFPNLVVEIRDLFSKRSLSQHCIPDVRDLATCQGQPCRAALMGSLTRHDGRWLFNVLNATTDGNIRNYDPIRQAIAIRQAGYLHWERRAFLVRLRVMCKREFITENSTSEFAHFLWRLLRLPTAIFQLVVMFV